MREIRFIREAVDDYGALDGSIKQLVNEKIDKLKENPFLGEALGSKNNIDLTSVKNDKKEFTPF
jgi:mRNA-degrading endonuclease RelE of RelBE toxin-antitoxin system